MLRFFLSILLAVFLMPVSAVGGSGQYQYSVGLRGYVSSETGKEPQAFLWLPEGVDTVRALVVAQQNMTEEALFHSEEFKGAMSRLGIGLVWIAPWLSQSWDPHSGVQQVFDEMLVGLAGQSGHGEIAHRTAIIPFGHSAQATFPWNFAAWNNSRTLCVVSFHGDAPRTNLCGYGTANVEWGRDRNIDGIPGLMVEGEYEWWEARVRPALAFRMMYPGACVSFLCDTGRGHFDLSPETVRYIARFIAKSLAARQPVWGAPLTAVDPAQGWLAPGWAGPQSDGNASQTSQTKKTIADNQDNVDKRGKSVSVFSLAAAPYAEYAGDRHEAFWYFDREMADLTLSRYARDASKGIRAAGVEWQGRALAPAGRGTLRIALQAGEVKAGTFWLKATGGASAHIDVICGPVALTGRKDRRGYEELRLVPYECGTDNPRRSFTAWVVAVVDGDDNYKDAVLPVEIKIK